jgi:hypothetical protein
MKTLALTATGLVLLSGVALATPGEAAQRGRHYGDLSRYERAVIARSKRHLDALKWRVRADGRVSFRERVLVRRAEARHAALVRRLRYN